MKEEDEIESSIFKELQDTAEKIDKKNIKEKEIKKSEKEDIEV